MVAMASQTPGSRLFAQLFVQAQIEEESNLRVTGFCEGNPPVTGGFPSQRPCNAENVSIWWRHHEKICSDCWTKRPVNWAVHYAYQCYVCHVERLHNENAAVMMTVWHGNDSRIAGLCEGDPPVTDGFPSQRANNVGLVFLWASCWKTVDFSVISEVLMLMWRHPNDTNLKYVEMYNQEQTVDKPHPISFTLISITVSECHTAKVSGQPVR